MRAAEVTAERVRVEITGLLTVQAEADGTTYLDAVESETAARARLDNAGGFSRRRARNEHWAATE